MNGYTIKDNMKYGEKLIKLGFAPETFCTPKHCEIWYNHCTEHNMKFLEGSYGTLINKDFNKYFEWICGDNEDYVPSEIWDKLYNMRKNISNKFEDLHRFSSSFLDHTNIFQSKIDEEVYILTASPYHFLSERVVDLLKKCNCSTYIFNPDFLDYYGFLGKLHNNHPLWGVNYGFTFATVDQMENLRKRIHKTVSVPFLFLVEGNVGE